jgi:hypothetical protein
MITDILFILLLNSLVILGVFHSADYTEVNGEIVEDSKGVLWWVKYYVQYHFGYFASKPIITCVACMASVWGTLYFPLMILQGYELNTMTVLFYFVYVPALSALNRIIQTQWLL